MEEDEHTENIINEGGEGSGGGEASDKDQGRKKRAVVKEGETN